MHSPLSKFCWETEEGLLVLRVFTEHSHRNMLISLSPGIGIHLCLDLHTRLRPLKLTLFHPHQCFSLLLLVQTMFSEKLKSLRCTQCPYILCQIFFKNTGSESDCLGICIDLGVTCSFHASFPQ